MRVLFTIAYKRAGLLSPWVELGHTYRYAEVRRIITETRSAIPECEYRVTATWVPT
jgi:hypothetical protein